MSDINDTKDTAGMQPDQEAKPALSADEQMIQDGFNALLQDYLNSNHRRKVERITKAFNFANQAHAGVKRRSGEPYIMHPIAVARIVCREMGLGSTSICSALLHDVVEDTEYTVEDIKDMFGEKIAHGTTFRRAVEEGLLDCERVVQIGLRAQGYTAEDFNWSRKQGFRVVQAEECWHKSLAPLMAEVREKVGGGPVYLSFDIDGIDPAWAPGTGTPEVGGLTSIQALEIVRGCQGLQLIGCDLVEVSPPYDLSGNTAQLGANLLYEMLCVLPGVRVR